uniref:Reverse transcriptase Ty1/copia-type domain-containing protein n=1 Tax=Photinus pyralis TaxID=7054 RepID=A0A1Y1K3D6_PHOPY
MKFGDIAKRNDSDQWMKAVNEEMNSLKRNETWSLVERPSNRAVITCKWIFSRKRNAAGELETYKARLVARGFTQREGFDFNETYSPVAKITTVRLLLALAVERDLEIHQMDVKTAFLNGKLEEDIYMEQPDGFVQGKLVCKLNKSLYGLKQASRVWNERFHTFVVRIGFLRSQYDQCLYLMGSGASMILLLLYVDDLILLGKNLDKILIVKRLIAAEFEMRDMGEIKTFLGINIQRNRDAGTLYLSQRKYLEDVLRRFNMNNCNPVATPMEIQTKKITRSESEFTKKPYRELIGCLMYIAYATRPDLCAAVGYFSQFQSCATDEHWIGAKRILRYVKSSLDLRLLYNCHYKSPVLEGFADADYGSESNERKSISGNIIKVFGSTVGWTARKQTSVALSTTESEYISLAIAAAEIIWYRGILCEIGISLDGPTIIHEDNQGAIKIALGEKVSQRTKHIDIKYHFIRDCIEKQIINLRYIKTQEQQADIMTKGLSKNVFQYICKKIGLVN